MDKHSPIGIFDSGLGGLSVVQEILKQLPNEHLLYLGDSQYAPYGTKSKAEIIDRCFKISDYFMQQDVKAIVIACNTATAASVKLLRETYPIPIVSMEPALKPAAYHKRHQKIIVMATPLTLKEERFKKLLATYTGDNQVIQMPCPELVQIVENDALDDQEQVIRQLQAYYKDIDTDQIDTIVLGCTHFVFFRSYLRSLYPAIQIIDGNEGTARQLKNVLSQNDLLNDMEGSLTIQNTSTDERYLALSFKLLQRTL